MSILSMITGSGFSLKLRRDLYNDLMKYLKDGIAIVDALQDMHDEYKSRGGNKNVIKATSIILAGMSNGLSFARALKGRVPDSEQAALYAGEKSGDLVEALRSVVEVAEATQAIRKTIRTQTIYPVMLFAGLFLVIHVMASQALPIMASSVPENGWASGFAAYYHSVSWLADNTLVVLGIIAALLAVLWSMLKLPFHLRVIIDGWWPWQIYRSIQSAIFLMSLANLMRSGRALGDSLDDIHSQSSPYVRDYVQLIKERVSRGMKAGKSLDVPFFDTETAIRLSISSKHRGFEEAMQVVAREAVASTIQAITAGLLVLRMIGMGLVFAFITWTLTAIFEFSESARAAANGLGM